MRAAWAATPSLTRWGRAYIGDGMEVKKNADIPMSAMWTSSPGQPSDRYDGDIRESASVAHIYGQNIAAAESLTARTGAWGFSPETLKPTADRELAMGPQPLRHSHLGAPACQRQSAPASASGPSASGFTRHDTWAESAGLWVSYLSRSSYMLQQGKFVADIAYFYGEDSNITALFAAAPPPIPAGYNFDYVNADVVLNKLSVANGRLVTPTGMSYRMLYLDPKQPVHDAPRRPGRSATLVTAGALVAGARPLASPSLADDQAELREIVEQLWGSGKVASSTVRRRPQRRRDRTGFRCPRHDADVRPSQAGRWRRLLG